MQPLHSERDSYCLKCKLLHCGTEEERSSTSGSNSDEIGESGDEAENINFRFIFQGRKLQLESDDLALEEDLKVSKKPILGSIEHCGPN